MLDLRPRASWGYRQVRAIPSGPTKRAGLSVHHGVTPPWTGVHAPRGLQDIHLRRGFAAIGYTFVAGMDGIVWEGRPLDLQGGHTRGHNLSWHAVCVPGDFRRDKPTAAVLDAVARLHRAGVDRGWWHDQLVGHSDLVATTCPGPNLYEMLAEIRRRSADLDRPDDPDPVEDDMIMVERPRDKTNWLVVGNTRAALDTTAAIDRYRGQGVKGPIPVPNEQVDVIPWPQQVRIT